jgi:RNA polymerase sigma-70 factor, ECF subfamily
MEDPEFDLITAIAHGDQAAFEQLVRRYQNPVITFICRYIGDYYAAQDLAQEVFLRVFQAAPKFKPLGKVSSWVFRIAYNLSANELKRRKRLRGFLNGMSAEGRRLPGGWSTSQTESGNRESEERLMVAMGQLPENQRAALLLKINEGLTYLEISNVMDVSVASVESLIFRARSRLKQLVRTSPGAPP